MLRGSITKTSKLNNNSINKMTSKKAARIRSASPAVHNPNIMIDKKYYTPGVVPTHGIGVMGNKLMISKGDTISKIIPGSLNHKKKIRNKSLSKTAQYKNPLRAFSPENR